jgi:two-component system chemotaxis response regulator CheB
VLVADDSMFMRAAIRKMLSADPRLEVCGEAKDGQDAVEKARALTPDVVTMDFNMPRLDGISAVRAILKDRATPIVMLSAHTQKGARETLEALAAGATDFLPKPAGEVSAEVASIGPALIAKVLAASEARPGALGGHRPSSPSPGTGSGSTTLPPGALSARATTGSHAALSSTGRAMGGHASLAEPIGSRVVVLGISTGGPAALDRLLPQLPSGFPHSLLIVQHLPAGYTTSLAERLASISNIPVREARTGDRPQRGAALIAPGDFHLEVDDVGRLHLSQAPELHGVRPAADVTMRAAARAFGRRTVGVVMTGMGRDGADGLAAIRAAGGATVAQDRETSLVYGMPRAAFELGVVDVVASLDRIAELLAKLRE